MASFFLSSITLILIPLLAISINEPSCLFPVASASLDASTDREALLAFRARLWNDPSHALSSWNGTSNPCRWRGVSCGRRRQRVTALDLRGLRLAGPLSPHLGNLSFLRAIHLQENSFAGALPDQLGRLYRLRELNVSSNFIGDAIPQNLTNCSELQVLDMATNTISGGIPPEIGRLSKLQVLRLGHNQLTGAIPPSICNISSLSTLDLNTNNLTGEIPRDLGLLPTIKHMQISINNIMGTIPLSLYNASSLVTFALASNQLIGEFPGDLGFRVPNLQTFHICFNQFTGPIPLSLNNITGIRSLRMSNNLLTGELPQGALTNLPDLVMYNIGFNPVSGSSDDIIASLVNSSKLEYLAFDETLIEGIIPEDVGNLSGSLAKLYAGGNRILGKLPSSIGRLGSLTLLNLSHNHIFGDVPPEIGQLQELQMLGLAGNKLSGEVPTTISNLTRLTKLELFGNGLSGRIPAGLGGLQRLLSLDLSNNELNGSIPRQVFDLRSLTTLLNLSRNSLTGSIPQEIGGLENVAAVDLSHNVLAGSLPDTISKCRSLEVLSISHNQLSGPIPDSLAKVTGLRSLKSLDLSSNHLSGPIPPGLGDLQALQFLNLSFNDFVGGIPQGGIFTNTSNVHLQGNPRLCLSTSSFCLNKNHGRHLSRLAVVIISLLCASALLLLIVSGTYFYRKVKPVPQAPVTTKLIKGQPRMVTYEEILRATDNFDSTKLIGTGGFGSVYKAILADGVATAIKVLDLGREGASKSFTAECEALRNVRHRNLVKLVTSCSAVDFRNNDFRALIYEFMANGSLEDWIRGRRRHNGGGGLDVTERLGVAVDVASAMDYLHHDCEMAVVHGDLKPSNVLMAEDMVAKVGDFGLAKLVSSKDGFASTTYGVKGSIGYIPPEYGMGSRPSTRGDVYSYGIMLLELFTGQRPTDPMFEGDLTLERWVRSASVARLMDALDIPELVRADGLVLQAHQISHQKQQLECLSSIIEVALSCTAEQPEDRPDMRDVLRQLKGLRGATSKPREKI